jgi:DNA-binding transcriptional regulator GbsR (MarR family)
MNQNEVDRFIESWGSMGVRWGINRSMARIHALVLVSEEPIDLDHVSERLRISRGNASMCLKDLRNWGVIQRVHTPGDRRDFYVAEPDVWNMLFRIIVERKKREFDPSLSALRHLMAEGKVEKTKAVRARLAEMETLLSTVSQILTRFLKDESTSKTMFGVFTSLVPK